MKDNKSIGILKENNGRYSPIVNSTHKIFEKISNTHLQQHNMKDNNLLFAGEPHAHFQSNNSYSQGNCSKMRESHEDEYMSLGANQTTNIGKENYYRPSINTHKNMRNSSIASTAKSRKDRDDFVIMRDNVAQTEFDDTRILTQIDCRKCVRCGQNDTSMPGNCCYSIQCPGSKGDNQSTFCIMYKEKTSSYHVYPKSWCFEDGKPLDKDTCTNLFKRPNKKGDNEVKNRDVQTMIGLNDILQMDKQPLDTYSDVDMCLMTPKSDIRI